jgi:hypothetical protein
VRPVAAVIAGLATIAAGCGGSTTVTVTSTRTVTTTRTVTETPTTPSAAVACTGGDLSGSFDVVRGSAGAGQVSYALTLTNSSQSSCFVSGIPEVQLVGADGSVLPTQVSAAHPGQGTAAKIALQPGQSATAQARFSPDVPGVGDRQGGQCQPKAATLRVTMPSGGAVAAPVRPPTSVCERGSLRFDLLASSS